MLESSQAAHIEASREVLRCPHCHLNQFMTGSGNCRKCRKDLIELKPEVPVMPPVVAIPERPCGAYDIGCAIRILRQAHGLNRVRLAARTGQPRQAIYKHENNLNTPDSEGICRYASAFGIPPSGLIQIAEACAA